MKLRSFKTKTKKRPFYDDDATVKKKSKSFSPPAMPDHLRKKTKKKPSASPDKVAADVGDDWATTDTDEIKGQMAAARSASGANRPPELYLKDGEKKRIRFRVSKPIAGFFRYSVRLNGQWRQFTVPPKGKTDLFRKKGFKPGHKLLYEVIDITGYTDKQGKRHRYIARFLLASGRLGDQIETLRKKFKSNFTEQTFEFSRSGQSTATTYMLIPEGPSRPKPEELKAERLEPKWRKFYAPPSTDEQNAVVGNVEDPESPF